MMDPCYKFGIVTVSSTRDRSTDLSGKKAAEILAKRGQRVEFYTIVKDEIYQIRKELRNGIRSGVECMIFCGGTGITKDDLTIEALEPLMEKIIPGFGEIFRQRSISRIGSDAMITRALAGIVCGIPVFCIPGSPDAVQTGLDIVLDQIQHIMDMIRHGKHSTKHEISF